MKKILFYTLMLCLSSFALTSCNDDNDELTDAKVTYYPTMELNGDETVLVPIGTEYVEQGCKALLRGEDVTNQVVINSNVNNNVAGMYQVNYTFTNTEGYSNTITRTVAVCDPTITTDIAGNYTVQDGTYRIYNDKTSEFSKFSVSIKKLAQGLFYISDLMAGYYGQGVGYGAQAELTGYLQLMSDNSLKLLSSYVSAWGDSANSFENGKYDPATGTISYDMTYNDGNMLFHVILK